MIGVTGSRGFLHEWTRARLMTKHGNRWVIHLEVPRNVDFEFKVVVANAVTGAILKWEWAGHDNRTVAGLDNDAGLKIRWGYTREFWTKAANALDGAVGGCVSGCVTAATTAADAVALAPLLPIALPAVTVATTSAIAAAKMGAVAGLIGGSVVGGIEGVHAEEAALYNGVIVGAKRGAEAGLTVSGMNLNLAEMTKLSKYFSFTARVWRRR